MIATELVLLCHVLYVCGYEVNGTNWSGSDISNYGHPS